MARRRRRWLGALAGLAGVTAGALGAAVVLRRRSSARERKSPSPEHKRGAADRWARPGMSVTFRAELMPGRSRSERTFRVAELLPSNRVTLEGFTGEHGETEFEPPR
ncbi:MAG TPA: hypothetical protein VG148_04570 [Pyrinomonadaceae bacterium]|nr:hypothetical protein [Pyrinomonadaceae bacterium]